MMHGLLFRRSRRFANRDQGRDAGSHTTVEFLSNDQVADLGQKLDARTAQLRQEIRERLIESDEDGAVSLIDQGGERDDDAIADLFADLDVATVARQVTELRDIVDARARLRAGSIGNCASCDGVIAFARLRANPAARFCIDCQRRKEISGVGGKPRSVSL